MKNKSYKSRLASFIFLWLLVVLSPLNSWANSPSFGLITNIENGNINDTQTPYMLNGVEILLNNQFTPKLSLDIASSTLLENNTTSLSIDEAYLSLAQLPLNSTLSIGKKLLSFGKINQSATEARPFNDMPLAFTSLIGNGLSGNLINIQSEIPFFTIEYSHTTPEGNQNQEDNSSDDPLNLSYPLHCFRAVNSLTLGPSRIEIGANRLWTKSSTNSQPIQSMDLTGIIKLSDIISIESLSEYYETPFENSTEQQKQSGYFSYIGISYGNLTTGYRYDKVTNPLQEISQHNTIISYKLTPNSKFKFQTSSGISKENDYTSGQLIIAIGQLSSL